uniref:ABC transporter substrate-binding protein n=1 Tax=Nonomuraea bangladeshensis TaxID=404385 RepID=UPI003F493E4B
MISRGLLSAVVSALLVSGCGQSLGGGHGTGGEQTIKIGFVSAQTGPLAGFGEADAFVVKAMQQHFVGHPITVGGKTYKVQILLKDAQSDSTRAGQVAADLINNDGVDVLLATGTPDVVNPVSDQCETNGTPCVTTVAPWQPYFYGRGGKDGAAFTWTYHFFWGLEDVARIYQDMWSQVDAGKKVAGLFPNDADGKAWSETFPGLVKGQGHTITDPGLYTTQSQDFSSQIATYKKAGTEILTGVPIPPDFTTFWKQAKQQDYAPKIATIGKALLFPSSVEALGDLGDNLGTEVWWSPAYPFTSSLTGQSAKDLAAAYEKALGKQWTQPIGFSHALFEVTAAAVTKAGTTDKQAVANALKSLKVSTVVGNLDWTSGPVPNVAKTPLAGGQWRKATGTTHPYDLVIVSNAVDSTIPVAGKPAPLH